MLEEDKIDGGAAVKAIADLTRNGKPIAGDTIPTPDGLSIPVAARAIGEGEYAQIDVFAEAMRWRTAPMRREGTATVFTLTSFIDLVNRHKDDSSAVFADILGDNPRLTAVIDYHTIDHKPRFGKHRVVYPFPLSVEWKAWKAKAGPAMSQGDFALWVEDHIEDLSSADVDEYALERLFGAKFATPADMMTLARGLTINVESKVGSVVNPQTGEGQILWEEAHKDSDGKPLKVPGLFVVSIPLFVGGDPVRLVAKLRYRKEGGKLSWAFAFYRWQDVLRAALLGEVERVTKGTELPVFEGAAEA